MKLATYTHTDGLELSLYEHKGEYWMEDLNGSTHLTVCKSGIALADAPYNLHDLYTPEELNDVLDGAFACFIEAISENIVAPENHSEAV